MSIEAMDLDSRRASKDFPTHDRVRVVIGHNISSFRFWPRSGSPKRSRHHVFQCADILEIWCDTIGKAEGIEPLFVAVLGCDDEPLLSIPLGIRRRRGISQLIFLDKEVSDYNAPIVFPGARNWTGEMMHRVWQDIVAALPAFDVAVLKKMPEIVEDWPNPLRFLSTMPCPESGHALRLPDDWSTATQTLLPNWRRSRQLWRKLSRLGEVRVETPRSTEEAKSLLGSLVDFKRRQLVETGRVDTFKVRPGYADYYVQATSRMFESGTVHLSALKVDGRTISATWGLISGARYYDLLCGYENEPPWRSCGPGRLHQEHLMEWCVGQGLEVFDFGWGDETYKTQYCDIEWRLGDAILPYTPVGKAFSLSFSAKRFAANQLRRTQVGRAIRSALSR